MKGRVWARARIRAAVLALAVTAPALLGDEVLFRRGDVNVDGVVDSGDVYIYDPFLGAALWEWGFPCLDAVDVDDDGRIDLSDMVRLLNYLFLDGDPPAPPGPWIPGPDTTPDSLDCKVYDLRPMETSDDFCLGFDGPVVLEGAAPPFRGVAFATLSTAPDAGSPAVGWSVRLELEGDGLGLVEVTTDGTTAAPEPEGRWHGGFAVAEILLPAGGSPPQGGAATPVAARSSVILSFQRSAAGLPAGSAERILRLTIESSLPPQAPAADQTLGKIAYVDGTQPWGVELRNVIHSREGGKIPSREECEISLELADAWQLPGDCSQDGRLDISDSICLLGLLFLGTGHLPCGGSGGGQRSEVDLGSSAVLDSNGDGLVDISDSIHVLGFLFLGSAPPALGAECIAVSGCPSVCR